MMYFFSVPFALVSLTVLGRITILIDLTADLYFEVEAALIFITATPAVFIITFPSLSSLTAFDFVLKLSLLLALAFILKGSSPFSLL